MNTVSLIGRLTKNPEVKYSNETAVARFNLAIDRPGKDKGADYISCVAFGKTAEVIEKWVTKGKQIGVMGRIQTGSYEKEGKRVYTTDVVAERIELLGSAPSEKPVEKQEQAVIPDFATLDESIPF